VKRGYVDSEWGQVHYRTAGSSGPSVVILHESPLSSKIFEPTVELLGASTRVWAFDTPGYGLSDPPHAPPEITDYARVLLGAVDALGIDKFAVVGSHTGVSIALEMLERSHAERITHSILTGIPLFTDEQRTAYLAHHAPDIELRSDGQHLLWSWDRYHSRSLSVVSVETEATEAEPAVSADLDFVNLLACHIIENHRRFNWGYRAAFRHDVRPGLRKLLRPTLILNSDLDTLAHLDEEASEIIPNASVVRLRGVGGRPYWLAPEQYAGAVVSFLLGHDAGQVQ
jgi:pimeloyl-ACP methyl ester carboxylesterase